MGHMVQALAISSPAWALSNHYDAHGASFGRGEPRRDAGKPVLGEFVKIDHRPQDLPESRSSCNLQLGIWPAMPRL